MVRIVNGPSNLRMREVVLVHKIEEGVVNILQKRLWVLYQRSQLIPREENWVLF